MSLKEAEVECRLEVGVVQSDGQIGLLCLLGLQQLFEDSTGIIGSDHLDFIPRLIGEFSQHFIGKGCNVVGQDAKFAV